MKNILLCSMHSPLEIFPKKCRFKLFESCLDQYMAKKNRSSNNVVLQSSTLLSFVKLHAKERNNSQHCLTNNVGSAVQTDATTANNVGTCSALWEGYNP